MAAKDDKYRLTDVVRTKDLLRLIQSVPSLSCRCRVGPCPFLGFIALDALQEGALGKANGENLLLP